jgi:tetratricopeptide (TPR) repeat protein
MAVLAAFAVSGVMGQTVKKTKDLITQGNWVEAKASIDATLQNPKLKKDETAEAWYLKGKVYSALVSQPATKAAAPADARTQAFEAIKKAVELDKTQSQVWLTMDQFAPMFNLYTGNFEDAAGMYNEEKYADALREFENTGVYGDYIFGQGWGLYKLDTTLTYYTALAALNAKDEEKAMKYFTKLADAKVSAPEHATVYRALAKYYYDKKDEANMLKYINLGRQIYPNDDYLPLLELDYIRDKGDRDLLMKKFDEVVTANPNNFDVTFEYANELFSETHVSDISKKPANYDAQCKKIEELYTKAASLRPENMDVHLSLGKHYYNMALLKEEESRAIKSSAPDGAAKKASLAADVVAICEKSIPPLEIVFNEYDPQPKLKTHDRSNYKSASSLLQYAYDKKKDKAKADFYQKKYDEADKKQ